MSDASDPPDSEVERCWSYETASRMLPDVRRLTQRARANYEQLRARRDSSPEKTADFSAAEQGMRRCLSQWVREMEALGVTVTGLWRIEFGAEQGAFPWSWPEETLRCFREDDEVVSIH